MNATSIISKIVEQQKKLRELAEANGIDEAIVNMGATADPTELYKIMYPNDDDEEEENLDKEIQCPNCDCFIVVGQLIKEDEKYCENCWMTYEDKDVEETWECFECGKEMVEKEISRQLVNWGCLCKECDKFPEDKDVIHCDICCCYATEYVVKSAHFTRYNEERYYHCLECEKTK